MEIALSADKHGVSERDILHGFEHAIRYIEYDYEGEDRILVIGPDHTGQLLELVIVPIDAPVQIIHAATLRPKLYDFLR